MVYLKSFKLLDDYKEHVVTGIERRRIFNSYYPLGIFPLREFEDIDFENITIFYGGNGSGKSTLLNIISEKLRASRKSRLDKGSIFDVYVEMCEFKTTNDSPNEIKVITSDDVFDYLLDIRAINANVNRYKEKLGREYLDHKFSADNSNFHNYQEVKDSYESRNRSMSQYIRARLGNNNIIEQSNGESALLFWEREITENSIYILDEPENSLSAENQLKLKQFIEESARFYNCQFIISTHSPFLLDLQEAKIYDLDSSPVQAKSWSELENIKLYHKFFKEREARFDNE